MEVGLREWLIVGAIIVIVLIVVDGWRRMRAQSNTLKIDIDDKLSELGNETYNPELPLGSARVFKPKDNKSSPASSARIVTKEVEPAIVTEVTEPVITDSTQVPKAPINELLDDSEFSTPSANELVSPKARIEPVFVEDPAPSDIPVDLDVKEENSVQNQEPISEASLNQITVDIDLVEEDITPNDVPETPHIEVSANDEPLELLNDSSLRSATFEVPDILKQQTPHVHSDIEQAQVTALGDTSETISTASSEVDDVIKEDRAASEIDHGFVSKTDKENTEEIVANLLHTLSKSKKSGTEQVVVTPSLSAAEDENLQKNSESSAEELLSVETSFVARENIFTTDKFELLLAEQSFETSESDPESELETEEAEVQSELAEDFPDENEDNSESIKLQEIEALKARLKELSVDEIENLVSDSESNDESEEMHEIINPQVTTVIDDDVDLENLDIEMSHFPMQIDFIDPQSVSEDVSNVAAHAEESGGQDVLDQEIADEETDEPQVVELKKPEQTEETDIDLGPASKEPLHSPDIEDTADPLMDGYSDQGSSQELVAQFEQDLAADQQAVSNELDMPITEILKKQQSNKSSVVAVEKSPEENNAREVLEDSLLDDPLLAINQLSDSLLSGADFDENEMLEARDEKLQDDVLASDKLGFTAFEQDLNTDPLMSNYKEVTAASDTVKQEKIKRELNQLQQKSFFDEPENGSATEEPEIEVAQKKHRKVITNVDDPNAVLIVTVVAKDQYLNGSALKRVVQACGMEFGDMDVFHRFEDGADQGAVQFSMANAINPGTFDIDTMDETSTPGVSFFMSMDEPLDPKKALECMLATAETVALHLHGDLLDDDRSVLRPQTKEHYKERIRIHEMNKLTRRAQ